MKFIINILLGFIIIVSIYCGALFLEGMRYLLCNKNLPKNLLSSLF